MCGQIAYDWKHDPDRAAVRADVDPPGRVGDDLAADLDDAGVGAFQPGDQPQRSWSCRSRTGRAG
jgi:hypothetical protein